MSTHHLKCWPVFYERLAEGTKTFEVRVNDRDYQAGDHLVIQEYKPSLPELRRATAGSALPAHEDGMFTGRAFGVAVTYVYQGIGVEQGFVVLGLGERQFAGEGDPT